MPDASGYRVDMLCFRHSVDEPMEPSYGSSAFGDCGGLKSFCPAVSRHLYLEVKHAPRLRFLRLTRQLFRRPILNQSHAHFKEPTQEKSTFYVSCSRLELSLDWARFDRLYSRKELWINREPYTMVQNISGFALLTLVGRLFSMSYSTRSACTVHRRGETPTIAILACVALADSLKTSGISRLVELRSLSLCNVQAFDDAALSDVCSACTNIHTLNLNGTGVVLADGLALLGAGVKDLSLGHTK